MHAEPSRRTAPTASNSLGLLRNSPAWEGAGLLFAMALVSLLGAAGIIVSLHGG